MGSRDFGIHLQYVLPPIIEPYILGSDKPDALPIPLPKSVDVIFKFAPLTFVDTTREIISEP